MRGMINISGSMELNVVLECIAQHYNFEVDVSNPNFAEIIDMLESKAERGNANALNDLSVFYAEGIGVEKNVEKAIRHLMRSAELDNESACSRLAHMYEEGEFGINENLEIALHYAKKAYRIHGNRGPGCKSFWVLVRYAGRIKDKIDLNRRIAQRTQVFVSYSHKDKEFLEELLPHLKMLRNVAEIGYWHDQDIQSGEKADATIADNLAKSKVAVLLVSANFFASDYIWTKELPDLLKAAEIEHSTVLWIPVRKCAFVQTPIGKYQAVSMPDKPLDTLSRTDREVIYASLVERIEKIFASQSP